MDAKAEFTKMLKDLQASAREFAALGLNAGTKALAYTGTHLVTLGETLKVRAEKLKKDVEPADAPKAAEPPAADTSKQ